MKNLLFLILLCFSLNSFSQYQYFIDVELQQANKTTITLLDNYITSYNRSIDNNRIIINTAVNYSPSFIDSLLTANNISVFGVVKNKTEIGSSVIKNGGVNCESAEILCSNQSFSSNSGGFGIQELNVSNRGCLSIEHQSSWYYLSIQNGGSLNLSIIPNNSSDDYDFAVWGPFTSSNVSVNCPPITSPIRCSYAATSGTTGLMNVPGTQASEGVFGDGWVEFLTVNPNEYYLLLIDNFSTSNSGYNIQWSGTSTLGCNPISLPLTITSFNGYSNNDFNLLEFTFELHKLNSYVYLEHSINGSDFTTVDSLYLNDVNPNFKYQFNHKGDNGLNYYRLSYKDSDNNIIYYKKILALYNESKKIIKITNLFGQEITNDYNGVKLVTYEDNSIQIIYR